MGSLVAASASSSSQINSSLYFFARCPEHETTKPYALRYDADDDLPRTNFVAEKRSLDVKNMRDIQNQLDFESCGFKIMPFCSSMQHDDWMSSEKIQQVYLKEVQAKLREDMGTPNVYMLDYAVRRRGVAFPYSDGPNPKDAPSNPIPMAHIDLSVEEAIRVVRYLYGAEADLIFQHPWHILTVWQPLSGPVRDWPLALCDASTVDPEQDTIASDIVHTDHHTENVQIYHNSQQAWYYLSDQSKDEALVFKTVYNGSLGCPHGSIPLGSLGEIVNPRESIDTRVLISFANLDPFPTAREDGFCSSNHL